MHNSTGDESPLRNAADCSGGLSVYCAEYPVSISAENGIAAQCADLPISCSKYGSRDVILRCCERRMLSGRRFDLTIRRTRACIGRQIGCDRPFSIKS